MMIVALILAAAAPAAPSHCSATVRPPLGETFTTGEFRIHYTLTGPDAPVDRDDIDHNGVPDMIENIATQLTAARIVYDDLFQLRPPLSQPRYALAHHVDVLVRHMNGPNGLSYDAVTRPAGSGPADCALVISLNNALRFDRNASPAHELFHLYQYGYALFKRGWYLEGMARWIESAYTGATAPDGPAPRSCPEAGGRGYATAGFWRALAARQGAAIAYPVALRTRTYVDGRPVFATPGFPGGGAVRPWLEALGRASDAAAVRNNLSRYEIPEAVRKSALFDNEICQAVERTAHK